MKPEYIHQQFEIVSYSWDKYSSSGKQKLASLLRTDEKTAYNFCNLYFNRFDLIHKLGHIFINFFNTNTNLSQIERERYATLFAVKYYQYKNENSYLSLLNKWFSLLMQIYKVSFNFDQIKNDDSYQKYKKDIVTFAATHFNCFNKCIFDPMNLEEIIKLIGNDKLNLPNKGIILRPGINGQDLLYECIYSVFEMNYAFPEITINYSEDINLDNIELIRQIN